jgi:hypothetical protein
MPIERVRRVLRTTAGPAYKNPISVILPQHIVPGQEFYLYAVVEVTCEGDRGKAGSGVLVRLQKGENAVPRWGLSWKLCVTKWLQVAGEGFGEDGGHREQGVCRFQCVTPHALHLPLYRIMSAEF